MRNMQRSTLEWRTQCELLSRAFSYKSSLEVICKFCVRFMCAISDEAKGARASESLSCALLPRKLTQEIID